MAYVERQIKLTITLQARQGLPSMGVAPNANPTFQGTTGNTVKILGGGTAAQNGLRISVKMANAGPPSFTNASIQIYNLPLSLINQLSTLGTQLLPAVGNNSIIVEAGNAGAALSTLLVGNINSAWADFTGAPDSVFNISAQVLGALGPAPAPAIGYSGPRAVGDLLTDLAKQAGLTLVNKFSSGVTPPLYGPYLSGSLLDQIRLITDHSGISWKVDDVTQTLVIGPTLSSLTSPGEAIPIISPPPEGNMIGYPSYTQAGVKVKTEFTTAIGYGTTVQVKNSQLTNANKQWIVFYLDYDLECQTPNGPWFTNIEMRDIGSLPPVAQPSAA